MDFFKVYLPSNACSNLYPNNTASDYRTRFDKAINLEGDWEVGVESITYSSNLNDEREHAKMELSVKLKKVVTVNSLYKKLRICLYG